MSKNTEIVETMKERKKAKGTSNFYKAQSDAHRGEVLEGDLARKVEALRVSIKRNPVNWTDLEDVRRRCIQYLENCRDSQSLPSVSGLAVFALGRSRQALNQYMREHAESQTAQFLQQMKDIVADTLETGALNRNIDTAISIFVLKNDHDRADTVRIEPITKSDPLGELMDPEILRKRIEDNIVIDEEF